MADGKIQLDANWILTWSSDATDLNAYFVPVVPGGTIYHQHVMVGGGGGYTSYSPDYETAAAVVDELVKSNDLAADYADDARVVLAAKQAAAEAKNALAEAEVVDEIVVP